MTPDAGRAALPKPPLPAWAVALAGKRFPFASPPGDVVAAQGTITFGDGPALWSKDRTTLWFDAVDDVQHMVGPAVWIDVKAVRGGFDVDCGITSESGGSMSTSPISGHKAKIKIWCPAGDVTELDFKNGIPLVLKWDATSGSWSTPSSPRR